MIPQRLYYFALVVCKKLRSHLANILDIVHWKRGVIRWKTDGSPNCYPGMNRTIAFHNNKISIFDAMLTTGKPLQLFFYALASTIILISITGLPSCSNKKVKKHAERSFYYWKSVLRSSDLELKRLDSLQVNTIYLKLFDVDWDQAGKQAMPVAKLQIQDTQILRKYNIIPAIFITNECMLQMDTAQTGVTAGRIYTLVKNICQTNQIDKIQEIQIDCDWTVATAKKYFSVLTIIKQLSKTNISATIRLHQIKFLSKTGVPPVDRGLLMCYNMGNLKNPTTKNSIIETSELKKYITNLSGYPLPLDVALPLFEWKVLFRNKAYKGLIENLPESVFSNSFVLKQNGIIEILKDTLLAGYYLKKGDLLRNEQSSLEEVLSAANEVNSKLKNTNPRVSLYHLDSLTLNKFTNNDLESIYNVFH